jgi:hypothetical protein
MARLFVLIGLDDRRFLVVNQLLLANAVGSALATTTKLVQHLFNAALRHHGFSINDFCIDELRHALAIVVDGDESEFHRTG